MASAFAVCQDFTSASASGFKSVAGFIFVAAEGDADGRGLPEDNTEGEAIPLGDEAEGGVAVAAAVGLGLVATPAVSGASVGLG